MIRRLTRVFDNLATAFLAGVLIVVVLQVFFRYVARIVVPWTEEATRYLGIWMVFMGAAAAVAHGSHITVTLLVERLPKTLRGGAAFLATTVALLFNLIVLLGSLQLIQLNWEQQAATFPVSVAVLYLALAVSAVASLLFLLVRIAKAPQGGT